MNKTLKTILCLLVSLHAPVLAYLPLNLVDTPTTETLPKGHYNIYFSTYEAGGIKTKVAIGLSDRFMLGISEDVGGVIGDGRIQFNIPGVMAKFNILRPEQGKLKGMGWAVGYDYFIEGEYGKTWVTVQNSLGSNVLRKEIIYGLYNVFSLPFRMFGPGQSFSFGARYPLLPLGMRKDFSHLTFFTGLDIRFTRELRLVLEVEEFNLDLTNFDAVLLNAGLRYVAGDVLGVSFNLRYRPASGRLSRMVTIEYQNLFF